MTDWYFLLSDIHNDQENITIHDGREGIIDPLPDIGIGGKVFIREYWKC